MIMLHARMSRIEVRWVSGAFHRDSGGISEVALRNAHSLSGLKRFRSLSGWAVDQERMERSVK